MTYNPKHIYIDDRVKSSELCKKIMAKFPETPQTLISDTNSFIKEMNKRPDAVSWGKEVLFLTENKGHFVKKCPGTRNYICCGYQILHPASQCNYDCSYCILQAYFNNPMITVFTNLGEMFQELDQEIDKDPTRKWRIGTGEYTDSLAFDDLYDFSREIIPFFMKKKNAILELKTKSTNIENLRKFKPKGNIIAAWSMNARTINTQEEHGASKIENRLIAAQEASSLGYKLAFHFDPIFYFNGWEAEYKKTVNAIFDSVDDEKIVWISMGCFRCIPSLQNIVEKRFPDSRFIYDEFITGKDEKLRYPKVLRIHIYKKMLQFIRSRSKNVFVYLCMESEDVWEKAFGYSPRSFGGLKKGLDAQVFDDISITIPS